MKASIVRSLLLPTPRGGASRSFVILDPRHLPSLTWGGEDTAHLIFEYLKLGESLAKIGIVTLSLIDQTMS